MVFFNPQLYPDPVQLAVQFYRQIHSVAARVKSLEAAAAAIDQFASGLAASEAANPYDFRRDAGALLRSQDARILVLVDDLDRLEPHALLSFFNLSSALALPRFIYLFSFDRDAARHSLEVAHVADAEAYLGKTIQLPYDVPEPDKLTLRHDAQRVRRRPVQWTRPPNSTTKAIGSSSFFRVWTRCFASPARNQALRKPYSVRATSPSGRK